MRCVKPLIAAACMIGATAASWGGEFHCASKAPRLNKEAVRKALGLPPTMAEVKSGYFPPHQRQLHYVLIEDVHGLPEAQGKIAAILLYAHHHWGSDQAFVEGAFGRIGPPPFPIFSVDRGDLTANELLRRGLFSGGELAAALAYASPSGQRPSLDVVGMDDPSLYRRQLEVLEKLMQIEEKAVARLRRQSHSWGYGRVDLLCRLIERRISPADFEREGQTPRPKMTDPLLRRAMEQADAYYRLTNLRSLNFARRTQTRRGRGPCLLVMGGFHAPALARILRAKGESYIVISPHLTQNAASWNGSQTLLKSLETLRTFPISSPYASPIHILRLTRDRKQEPITVN